MARSCQVCSRVNPDDGFYCYFDGRLLSTGGNEGPLRLGLVPFPTPFHFPDGQGCYNFNQLALACNIRWEEARSLLAEGVWANFFSIIGRLDLSAAARQAAAEPDPDRGLSQLLEKLPADADTVRPPTLGVQSAEEDLGQLTPGVDLGFELIILNKGMFHLHGIVSTNCPWLVFGDRSGPSQRMFQTRSACAIPMRVLGDRLRAGLQPLQGEIVIESNGGTLTVPVTAQVPVAPFPKGVHANDALAGARSPREIALKAKEHPSDAAILFAQGAVKAWYASNGWTYPIEGSEGSGKGAVQQFFEALGLTKPPRLEIDTAFITIKDKAGKRHARRIIVRTEEAKPVYAHAWSNQSWVAFRPVKYQGNKVEILVELTVPPQPGETVHAEVTIEGNGKQRFVVPVTVAVAQQAPKAKRTAEETDDDDAEESPTWSDWFGNLWKKDE
jgi:hypothetical protein